MNQFYSTGSAAGTLAASPDLRAEFLRQITPICPQPSPLPICNPLARYPTADGTCNNLASPLWGSSFRPHRRLLPPDYGDGE